MTVYKSNLKIFFIIFKLFFFVYNFVFLRYNLSKSIKKYNNLIQIKLKIFFKIDIDLFSILIKNSNKNDD